jgi:NhaP-type Na+/H+ or K+/H+ antiporter
VRDVISAESGANDGLAYLFVLLPLFVLTAGSPVAGLDEWLVRAVLWEVVGGAALGLVLGIGAGWLLEAAEAHRLIDRTSILAYSLALSLTVLGVTHLLGANDILAVFTAGCGFAFAISERDRHEEERMQEAVNRFFILPIFTLLGAALPWGAWQQLGWTGLVIVAGVLLLRRLPAVWVFHRCIGPFRGAAPALFAGWFGPIGVAALFYAAQAARHVEQPAIWPVATLMIASSTLVHGVTATPFIHLYERLHRR